MHLDWTIPVGTVILVALQFGGGVVAFMRALQTIEQSIEKRFAEISLILNTFKEGDLRELHSRVKRLEDGADEWTKALRERTHLHANDINDLKLKVDRLERPGHYPRNRE